MSVSDRQRQALLLGFAYVLRRRRRPGLPEDLVVLRIAAEAELWLAPFSALIEDAERASSFRTRREAHARAIRSARRDAIFAERLGVHTTITGSHRGDTLVEVRMRHPMIQIADRRPYSKALAARMKQEVASWEE